MAKIVLSTIGSLGDLHPMLALGLALKGRGHDVIINSWQGYREKADALGLGFHPLSPDVDPTDRVLARRMMDTRTGSEVVIRELILPNLRPMYEDMIAACAGADLMLNGEIVFAAPTVAETTGIKWISTSLAPLSMFSAHDPSVYPIGQILEYLRPLPAPFHRALFGLMKRSIRDWYGPVREFRRGLGLSENVDPIFTDKYSRLLHLALFSKALGKPQPDWFSPTLQTGFCFYDESEAAELPPSLSDFLDAGEPPIVFTLGSAASLDAGDFFDESARAAAKLGRRALLLYGRDNPEPAGLNDTVVGYDFAPYSLVFPRAACVVHQGGVGTTAQALRAGAAQLIVPFSHDQPDNAARCRRAGVAEILRRDRYTGSAAARALARILNNDQYRINSAAAKTLVDSEAGTEMACDAIEAILRM